MSAPAPQRDELLSPVADHRSSGCDAQIPDRTQRNGNSSEDGIDEIPEFVDHTFGEHDLWSCTTCGACLTRCPAFINPPEQVVDLRRYQVLMTGNMPKSVGDTLRNMERQGNPWGMPPENRLNWAEGLGYP